MIKFYKNLSYLSIRLFILVVSFSFLCGFENPATVVKVNSNRYKVVSPEGKLDYVFEKLLMDVGVNLYGPLGDVMTLVDAANRTKITEAHLNLVQDVMNDMAKDKVLDALTPTLLKGYVDKFSKAYTAVTSIAEIKKNLKNDTTNYELNILINRYIVPTSTSKMAAIAKYDYAKNVLNQMMKDGNVKVTLPSSFESTLRTKIEFTSKGKTQLESLKNDLVKIENEIIKRENATIAVTSVKLNKTSTTITKGKSEKLVATISPSNATNKDVTWSSSNTKVATVDQNGNVKAVGTGSATITVKTKDGSKTVTAKVRVK